MNVSADLFIFNERFLKIYTKMHNPTNDNEFFWDKNKFINRFYGMQELYQNYMEGYSNWDVSKVLIMTASRTFL